MELGESVASANQMQTDGKCAVCGKCHGAPKKEQFESTVAKPGWERDKSLVGVFASGDSQRTSIYPGQVFPPPFGTEGHHCIAHTTFIKKGKDRCVRLNHFLNKVGFRANQAENIIHLPGRLGDALPAAPGESTWPEGARKEYKCMWVSIDLGKPLQLHTGRHRGTYFGSSDSLYGLLMSLAADPTACEETTEQQFEDDLKALIKAAVNYAFVQVAASAWICHPEHLRIAISLYGKDGPHSFRYLHGSGRSTTLAAVGYPGTRSTPAPWQRVALPAAPFM